MTKILIGTGNKERRRGLIHNLSLKTLVTHLVHLSSFPNLLIPSPLFQRTNLKVTHLYGIPLGVIKFYQTTRSTRENKDVFVNLSPLRPYGIITFNSEFIPIAKYICCLCDRSGIQNDYSRNY
jgi:hypothetical protein